MKELALALPFVAQGTAMAWDEFYFHWRRGLGSWERIGHPVDTAFYLAPLALAGFAPRTAPALALYVGLAAFSCLLVTKDEWVHQRECAAAEQWLHSLLFTLHPIVLFCAGAWIWPAISEGSNEAIPAIFRGFVISIGGFMVYQILFWNWIQPRRAPGV